MIRLTLISLAAAAVTGTLIMSGGNGFLLHAVFLTSVILVVGSVVALASRLASSHIGRGAVPTGESDDDHDEQHPSESRRD